MNQDALSLTGLRLGMFSQILLILQEFDEASQTYDTRQEDIYNIFLESSRLEAQVTETRSTRIKPGRRRRRGKWLQDGGRAKVGDDVTFSLQIQGRIQIRPATESL